jgi:hypothetical protein
MEKSSLVHAVFLILLPIGVAWFELSPGSAAARCCYFAMALGDELAASSHQKRA